MDADPALFLVAVIVSLFRRRSIKEEIAGPHEVEPAIQGGG
jgi:hypothetical protein